MRPALLLLFVACASVATAQLSLTPQRGFENARTSVRFNDQDAFSPLGAKGAPQAALRFDYRFKKGHGPFLGVANSRSVVKYAFADPETGMDVYNAARGGTQLRLEGGYQVATKPIFFKKAASVKAPSASQYQKSSSSSRCGSSMARSSCGSKATTAKAAAKPKDTRTWMRIVPAVGAAYIPGAPRSDIYTDGEGAQTVYAYNAGNWRTALTGGVGFEFGKGKQSNFLVSLNYVRGLGMDTRTLTTMVGTKPATANLQSAASSWNVRMGIPISFAKKPVAKPQPAPKTYSTEKKCGQYKMQYKSRCTRVI